MGAMNFLVVRLVILSALLLAAGARAEVINVYTSANFAPLMLDDGRGVYPDLVQHLNHSKPGGYTFRLQFMPRKRLQVKLEEGSLDGLVIGLMPEWLADREQKKYLWTAPFAHDRFALVSLAAKPITPDLGAGAKGGTVGITTGYVYPGLDEWFFRSHLQRSGGVSDEKNIEKLLLGRVDCVIVAESMARYFIRMHKLGNKLRVYPMPGPGTERRFLVQRTQSQVFEHLAPAIKKLRDDPVWKRSAAAYE
jgi:polar amino acid transport system substrate-binding protein